MFRLSFPWETLQRIENYDHNLGLWGFFWWKNKHFISCKLCKDPEVVLVSCSLCSTLSHVADLPKCHCLSLIVAKCSVHTCMGTLTERCIHPDTA